MNSLFDAQNEVARSVAAEQEIPAEQSQALSDAMYTVMNAIGPVLRKVI